MSWEHHHTKWISMEVINHGWLGIPEFYEGV